jgi:hypothetical protein
MKRLSMISICMFCFPLAVYSQHVRLVQLADGTVVQVVERNTRMSSPGQTRSVPLSRTIARAGGPGREGGYYGNMAGEWALRIQNQLNENARQAALQWEHDRRAYEAAQWREFHAWRATAYAEYANPRGWHTEKLRQEAVRASRDRARAYEALLVSHNAQFGWRWAVDRSVEPQRIFPRNGTTAAGPVKQQLADDVLRGGRSREANEPGPVRQSLADDVLRGGRPREASEPGPVKQSLADDVLRGGRPRPK